MANSQKAPSSPDCSLDPNPAALARASDYENVLSQFHDFKEGEAQSTGREDTLWDVRRRRPAERADTEVGCVHSVTMSRENCQNLTEEPRDFIGLLLLDLLVIQSLEKDVQDHNVFSGGTTEKIIFLLIHRISHFLDLTVFHYCYIEG